MVPRHHLWQGRAHIKMHQQQPSKHWNKWSSLSAQHLGKHSQSAGANLDSPDQDRLEYGREWSGRGHQDGWGLGELLREHVGSTKEPVHHVVLIDYLTHRQRTISDCIQGQHT